MKKITALFFIALFLFNLFGYRFVVEYLLNKANAQLEAQFDNNLYQESQLVELKVPLHLPYQTDSPDFQRYDGEIELNGISYKYIKRKVVNDTLYVMCIPNSPKMHLETAKNEFFKITNDLAQNDNSKKSGNSKEISFNNLNGEYDNYPFVLNTLALYEKFRNFWPVLNSRNLLSSPHISPEQPPDFQEA